MTNQLELTEAIDVAVVGGGLAGLAAAALLARAGRTVVLFEKSADLGGRARTLTQDGYHFNLGPHALYSASHAASVLEELGIQVHGGVPGAAGVYAVRAGRSHTFPAGFVSLLSTGLLGPGEKIELARLLDRIARRGESAPASVPLADWLSTHVRSERVREYLNAVVRVATYANAPEQLSAGAALDQLRKAFKGVRYLDGGWTALVAALRENAEAAGVHIHASCAVQSVFGSGHAEGVILADGTRVECSAVLLAGSPQVAAEVAGLSQWAKMLQPVHASCLDVALSKLPRPHATVAIGIDRPLYASVHSAVAKLAPRDGALIHVARYGGLRGDPAASVKQELCTFLDDLQPGWRDFVVHSRFLPEMVVSNALVTAAAGGQAGRPDVVVREMPGLYLSGDWVGNEGMLADASFASARAAARAILAFLEAGIPQKRVGYGGREAVPEWA